MKSTILAAAILFSLAGPVPVLAEPVTELTEQQAVADTLSEAAAPLESQVVSETPAEDVAPADEMVAEQVTVETSAEEGAADAMASATDTPRQPCPMGGMGMMRKGMGQAGQGPGGRKPGCDHDGRGQQNVQEQVVRRLDMIEARMVKMEAMLESLMRR